MSSPNQSSSEICKKTQHIFFNLSFTQRMKKGGMGNVKDGLTLALFDEVSRSTPKMMEKFLWTPAGPRAGHRGSNDSAAQGMEICVRTFMTSLGCGM